MQALTIQGSIVEGARWEVDFPAGVQEGHSVALSVLIPPTEVNLLNYLSRSASSDAMLDKGADGISVALSLKVTRVRHMVEAATRRAETMCFVQPVNRLVEHIMTFLYSPAKCDPKFVRMVRGSASPD